MKTLHTLIESANEQLTIKKKSLDYLSRDELKKYLEVADKFLSNDAKDIINYLVVNNETYINDLAPDTDENALVYFYNNGKATTSDLKELKKALHNLMQNDRILEIPIFQTREEFDMIIKKEVSPDYVILNLDSPNAQNKLVKKYEPLLHKICRQYFGKSRFNYDELMSAAQIGFLNAMRSFGKKKDDENVDDNFNQCGNFLIKDNFTVNLVEKIIIKFFDISLFS